MPVNPDFYATKGIRILANILQKYVKPSRVPNTAVFINKAKTNNQYQLTIKTKDVAQDVKETCDELRQKESIHIKFIPHPILDRVAVKESVVGRQPPIEVSKDIQELWASIKKEMYE